MAEYILNLLPVTEEEKAAFQEAAPRAVHVCAGRRTVTAEQLEQATILFGWPRPADLSRAPRLKWFQSMWAGTDEYLAPGVLPEGVVLTSSAGSNSQSVAEHALACLLALCRRLPQCRDQQRERLWTDPGKMKTLSGATVLVAGAGHIGSWFAGLCRGLGAHTVGLKRDVSRPVEGFDRLAVMEELDGELPQIKFCKVNVDDEMPMGDILTGDAVITQTSATLYGTVTTKDDYLATYGIGIQYRKAADPESEWIDVPMPEGAGKNSFAVTVNDLTPETDYVYRVYVRSIANVLYYGETKSFRTPRAPMTGNLITSFYLEGQTGAVFKCLFTVIHINIPPAYISPRRRAARRRSPAWYPSRSARTRSMK